MDPASPRARFGALLRETRTRRRLRQADIGALVHVTPDAVATWERGRSLPDQRTIARLERHLDAGGALHAAWQAARADSPPDSPPVGRTAARPTASVLGEAAAQAAEFGAWAERLDSGDTITTTLALRAQALADQALTAPPADIVGAAADLEREVFTLLRGHHKPAHARDLYAVAGAVCALLAWLSGDLGALGPAKVHGAAAGVCADLADHPELHAWVAAVRSKTAFWCRDYPAAADLAARGLRRSAPGSVRTMLACQQADAYAMLADHTRIRDALRLAEDEAGRAEGTDRLGGLFTFGPARHANYAASAHLALGDTAGAIAQADHAAALFAAGGVYGFGTVAQVHIVRTLAHASAGDLEAAHAAARPVLDLPPARRLATLTERLRPLARSLDGPEFRGSRVAAPLREELAQFCGEPAQRAITAGPKAGDAA